MHKSSCRHVLCYMLISLRFSNLIRSCIKCLFVICVVFILSGKPINLPHSLLCYFSNSFFWQVFLSRPFSLYWSMILSVLYFRMFQHSIALLFLSMLFQSSFAKYFRISLYLPLWKFLLYCFLFLLFDFTLMSKYIWLWSLLPNGSCILTNSFCEDKTISNTFSPLVGSSMCWVRKLSHIKNRNCCSSPPVLSRNCHCMCLWLKSPIMIHSPLLTSLIAFCILCYPFHLCLDFGKLIQ